MIPVAFAENRHQAVVLYTFQKGFFAVICQAGRAKELDKVQEWGKKGGDGGNRGRAKAKWQEGVNTDHVCI